MVSLLGKTLEELQAVALEAGLPRFAGKQLAEWIYVKRAKSLDEMTNISLKGREALKQRYTIGRHEPVAKAESEDGTRKYLFKTPPVPLSKGERGSESQFIEAVYIPEEDRATLCVSTQAGCKMGCKFCMTGTLGFHGHLPASEILNQIFSIPESEKLTNIVYMGEGEPMDNIEEVMRSLEAMTAKWGCQWSPHRITVSSVGYPNGLKRFLDESECHLAISLHNPFAIERQQIMPIEKNHPVEKVLELIRGYDWTRQRRLSFEYICFGGQNDTPKHAKELLRLLRGLNCRVNLIRFHAGVDQPFQGSDEQQMIWLRDYLTAHGLTTTIRRSRGEDILAACGMLVNALQKEQ
ncbi:MAG: 23S rRNA (adenine(2503)-C(2))-methyltransferase RlmN [Paludibacteraceae bacterium]|nr:23S rRNA (adenine(2503)-C(2))-methyltransferase RlmN [Paludibacteraceae bacterium]